MKMSLSSNDLVDTPAHFDELDRELVNYPKQGRFTCKSESRTRRAVGEESHFSFNSWWHNPANIQQRCTNRLKSESSSLPCSPSHVMPFKMRFKQQKQNGSTSNDAISGKVENSEFLEEKMKPRLAATHRSNASNYVDDFIVTQSHDNSVEAYQNSDQLIIVSNDYMPDDDMAMDTGEEPKLPEAYLTSKPKKSPKIFRTPSEEIQEINDASSCSDDSVMVDEPSLIFPQPPTINVLTPTQNDGQKSKFTEKGNCRLICIDAIWLCDAWHTGV